MVGQELQVSKLASGTSGATLDAEFLGTLALWFHFVSVSCDFQPSLVSLLVLSLLPQSTSKTSGLSSPFSSLFSLLS